MNKNILIVGIIILFILSTVSSMAISNDEAIVDDELQYNSLNTYTTIDWTELAKLLASDGEAEDYFGCSVSIDGNYALTGSALFHILRCHICSVDGIASVAVNS